MASSKKSSTEAKGKEAGTSKPAPKAKTHNNARNSDKEISKKKKKKKKISISTNNGSVKDNEVLAVSPPGGSASEDDDAADEDKAETTSRKHKTSKSKKVKRNHAKEEDNGYAEEEEEEAEEKIYKFPMHRIKKIMRDENSDLRINQEALFLVNKASEMFLVQFCKDAYACCAQDRKKSLAYKHLCNVSVLYFDAPVYFPLLLYAPCSFASLAWTHTERKKNSLISVRPRVLKKPEEGHIGKGRKNSYINEGSVEEKQLTPGGPEFS
ncbi:DNA polymerase epsilon subunit C [Cucumis melo var. makuwa]|uniref:DNA polymerase epsilon subunit C n=1 Tax=Cucumis melo var. makuwa TaxID=1194695 RepID=A0A5A7T1L3_CUCMM|nr:DNA polymerase epsilon subunit C [Cucumis melo var. makuwa]TYK14302.1 DNA polymerase epsilon subunit C [Cucumis melo var. makuwa]